MNLITERFMIHLHPKNDGVENKWQVKVRQHYWVEIEDMSAREGKQIMQIIKSAEMLVMLI